MRFSRISKAATVSVAMVGFAALQASGAALELSVDWWSASGDQIVEPGESVYFQVGLSLDPTVGPGGNVGLGGVVYNVVSAQTISKGYALNPMLGAPSGYAWDQATQPRELSTVHDFFYDPDAPTDESGYGGGWGFDNGGLPGGGTTTNIGKIVAAGAIGAPFGYQPDVRPSVPGKQTNVLLGVGHGMSFASLDDPVNPGLKLGFGVQFGNTPVEGDGTWVVQEGVIDTSAWDKQLYSFDIDVTSADVFRGDFDYNVSHTGAARFRLFEEDWTGTNFSFTIVPEPASLSLMLMAGAALIRRRR